jgi:DNA-binding transcriptional ArsR family regulator
MPVVDSYTAPPLPAVRVETSVAVELEWAMATALHPDWMAEHPTLGEVYARRAELVGELRSLWPAELGLGCAGFLEIVVLAHHAGQLFGDAEALLGALPEATATAAAEVRRLPLRSETDEDRRAVLARLGQLRRSRGRREHYVEVLRRVWAALEEDWAVHGRPGVEQAVSGRRLALAGGATWQDVADESCFSDRLTAAVAGMEPGSALVVVPAYYTHKGMFVDLPGTLLVGVRSEPDGAVARARTEGLARQLKAISDPTRLAILDALGRGPRTVTELAAAFSLSQPTVSNHVKLLRDAGLVGDGREGRRRRLAVRSDQVDRLVGGLRNLLTGPGDGPGQP